MNSSKVIKISLVLALVVLFLGCSEDFLVLDNPNRLTDEDIKSASGIRQLEIGMYERIATPVYNYFWQTYMSHLPGEYEFRETTGEGPDHLQVWNLNMAPTNRFSASYLYSGYYESLANTNRIIEYLEEGPIDGLDERESDLILGGAYFLRAFNHFYLLHSWGRPFDEDDQYGIVMHTSIVSERQHYEKARSRPSEVYQQIEKDLKKAEEILPLASQLSDSELGRATRGAATAYLGKVYLFQKKYEKAAEKFQQFIDENPDKGLLPYFGDNFNGKYRNGPESVFELQYADLTTTSPWMGGGSANHYQMYVGGHGMGRDNVAVHEDVMIREDDSHAVPGKLSNFDVRDIRFSETVYSAGPTRTYIFRGDTIQIRDTLFFLNPPRRVQMSSKNKYTPKKYISNYRNASNSGGMAPDVSYENQIVMRVAEVYLLHAEALAHLNRIPEATVWLNKIIRRARGYYLDETTPFDFTGNTLDEFMELLIEEKRKEFIGEQIRWYDVIRWGIAESEIARVEGRPAWNDRAVCFPIPAREIANNPNMVQNPGY